MKTKVQRKTPVQENASEAASLSADERLRTEEHIRIRAHELWLAGGRRDGNNLGDWLQAEQELLPTAKRREDGL